MENTYEKEKKDLLEIAEETYGKDFLNEMDNPLFEIEDDEKQCNFHLINNSKGAFYAYED